MSTVSGFTIDNIPLQDILFTYAGKYATKFNKSDSYMNMLSYYDDHITIFLMLNKYTTTDAIVELTVVVKQVDYKISNSVARRKIRSYRIQDPDGPHKCEHTISQIFELFGSPNIVRGL